VYKRADQILRQVTPHSCHLLVLKFTRPSSGGVKIGGTWIHSLWELLVKHYPNPEFYYISPFGAVEKQLNGAFNRHDLSCPHGKSVDDGTKEHYGSLMYQTVDKSQCHSPHSKRDLKDAFHKSPASPLDHWYWFRSCTLYVTQRQTSRGNE